MDQHSRINSTFRQSRWFTRGWTLQELLAPASVEFYDQNWFEIGKKSSMRNLIQEITTIQALDSINDACVAEKMSWAANRETNRTEDQADCLMGLFDINMPLLYGEGEKAFLRLQREIWTATNDDSVFAWNLAPTNTVPKLPLFACTPTWFESSGGVHRSGRIWGDLNGGGLLDAMSVTNKGVDLDSRRTGPKGFPRVPPRNIPDSPATAKFLIPLRCGPRTRKRIGNAAEFFAVFLIQGVDSTWYRSDQLGIVDINEIQTAKSTSESNRFRLYIPHLLQSSIIGRSGGRKIPSVFFNIASLRGTGFQVNEFVWDTYPEWLEILGTGSTDPEGVLLRSPYTPLGYSLSLTVAVGISDSLATNFALLYEYAHAGIDGEQSTSTQESTSLYVMPRAKDEILKDTVNRRLQADGPIWSRDKSDRISWPISNGRSMSAAVKRGVDLGRSSYIVYITLDEEGEFPWPVPFHAKHRAAVIERRKKATFF
jgi:hypothetical protein